jgi:hypothetical protein
MDLPSKVNNMNMLFDPSAFTIATRCDHFPCNPKRRTYKHGLRERKQQVSLFTLQDGTWIKKPLPEIIAPPKKSKAKRKIDWASKLILGNYDQWLNDQYRTCEQYGVSQAKAILGSYLDDCDCIQEGMDATVTGIMKVRTELENGPLASGSFVQYTKTAIKRVLIDRNRRDLAVRHSRLEPYRYQLDHEYQTGTEITLESEPETPEADEMTVALMDWIKTA